MRLQSLVFAVLMLAFSGAQASVWNQYWVNMQNQYGPNKKPFNAKISFTTDRLTPTIGLESGGIYAPKLFVEIFTLENGGTCPELRFGSANKNGGPGIEYAVPLTYDASEKKCWGEVSDPSNVAYFLPGYAQETNYSKHPVIILPQKGLLPNQKVSLKSGSRFSVYLFNLADAL